MSSRGIALRQPFPCASIDTAARPSTTSCARERRRARVWALGAGAVGAEALGRLAARVGAARGWSGNYRLVERGRTGRVRLSPCAAKGSKGAGADFNSAWPRWGGWSGWDVLRIGGNYTLVVLVCVLAAAVIFANPNHSAFLLLPDSLQEALLRNLADGSAHKVLLGSGKAALKLVLVCVLVSWMTATERLPTETPVVLSKLAFNLILPAFLCSKVAATMSGANATLSLAALPLLAIVQVGAGAALGGVCASIVCRMNRSMASGTQGWHPTRPAASAESLAVATATAVGLRASGFSRALIPKEDKAATQPIKRVVTLACAFGNSFTLPLVFLSEVLPAAQLDVAASYIALFLVGWSPALWGIGYQILNMGVKAPKERSEDDVPEESSPSAARRAEGGGLKMAAASGARLLNPPLMGILAGVFIGATPLAAYVLPGSTPPPLSLELSLFAAVGRCAMDAVALLGAAALPIQTIVLAVSIAPKTNATEPRRQPRSERDLAGLSVLLGVSVVRLVVLPALTLGLVLWLRSLGLLPADPLVALVLLVQAAMPSAQNLVLLMQLQPATRYMAPKMAGMLLRQYALATLSVTAWTSVFVALLL